MANQFYVPPLGGLQTYQGIGDTVAAGIEQNQAQDQRQQLMQQASDVFESGDPRAIAQFSIQNPEMAETLQGAFGFSNEQTKPIVMNTYQQALANPDRAAEIMQQGIEQVTAAGGRPTNMTRDLQLLQQDPEAGLKNIEMGFAAAAPDTYDRFFGQAGGPKIGTYNPRDYTPKSFAEFTKTGDPAVLERYASQRSVDIGGVPHVFDPAMGGYRPAGVSGATGRQPITAETVGESEAEITRRREGAKQEVKAQSPSEVRQQQAAIKSTRQELSTAQDTISQIDNLMGNEDYIDALTGVKGKLPGIPGTEGFDADVAFDQFRNSLTLENLGKMSGVLSETDIKILSSAASGLEPGMSEDAFKARMETIRNVLEGKSEKARRRLEQMQGGQGEQPQGMSEEDADAFIDSILGQ